MNSLNKNLKIAIVDSSDTWYAQPKLIFNELVKMGQDVIFLGQPNNLGYQKIDVPTNYIKICIANNLSPIDVFTDKLMDLNHPPLERAFYSDADFVFVGDKTIFLKFFSDRPNAYYMPYAANEIFTPLSVETLYDISFVGNLKFKERIRRIDLLKKQFNIFVGSNHFMDEANLIMNQSKIIFNTCDGKEINMRIFEALGTGKMLITEKINYLDELFVDGEHIVTYKDDNELIEKMNYYLEHPNEREQIAKSGNLELRRKHTYRHRANFILEKILQSDITYRNKSSKHLQSKNDYKSFYELQSAINLTAQERIFDFSLPDSDSDGKYDIRNRLKEALKVARGKVLDVGCQRGGYSFNLKNIGCDVTAIDISFGYIKQAKEKVNDVKFAQSDAESLPFKDNTFDTVILSEVLEHVSNVKTVVNEVYRVLKPNGILFLTVPAYEDDSEEHVRLLLKPDLVNLFSKFKIEFRDVYGLKSIVMVASKLTKKLKILLTTHHLLDFTGSEIYTLTLAEHLKNYGCEVKVYSRYADKIIAEFEKLGIQVFTNLEEIKNQSFDIAHVHHSINAAEVRYYFPELPIVFASHGILPFLEQPSKLELGISNYIAVSDEVKNNLVSAGIEESAISVIRNLIDEYKFLANKKNNVTPKNVLVISSRIDASKENSIRQACKLRELNVQFIGGRFGQVNQQELREMIGNADLVFSLGRGAVESMLMNRAVIIFDYQGGDGLITIDNFEEIMKCNFSGRRFKKNFTVEELIKEIDKYDFAQVKRVREIALKYFSASKLISEIVDVYNLAINEKKQPLSTKQKKILEYFIKSIQETRNYTTEITNRKNPNTVIEDQPNSQITISELLIENNQLSAAKLILTKSISENPLNFDALNNLAVIHIMEEDFNKALNYLKQVLAIDSKNEVAVGNLQYLQELIADRKKVETKEIIHA